MTFLALGFAMIGCGVRLPSAFDLGVELLVASTLLALGVPQLWGLRRWPKAARFSRLAARPVALGSIHGLAGSAALALASMTTIRSAAAAALYLVLCGVGTVVGMVVVTLLLAWSFHASKSFTSLHRPLVLSSALASTMLGTTMLVGTLGGLFHHT